MKGLDDILKKLKKAFPYIPILVYFAFITLPIIFLILGSLGGGEYVTSPNLLPKISNLTFRNLERVIDRDLFWIGFLNSGIVAGVVTIFSVAIAIPTAYAFSKTKIRGGFISLIFSFLGWLFPLTLLVISFYEMSVWMGILDTRYAIVLSHLALVTPVSVWLLKGFFDGIKPSLINAARIDGCSLPEAIWNVLLPIAKPGLAVAAFFSFIASWGNYIFANVLIRSNEMMTMPIALQHFVTGRGALWGQISAATLLSIIPVIIFFAVTQRWIVKGFASGMRGG
ncbi:hypothetical protein AKJ65_05585 [candidate division MSBL1 archaeon SCGC-AAA259E19]|uniref:ABC transmembrane type-1 domain-containing protein n=1 Tax=candidate division MSBL1 archaeon SCGC-AAA259E19 TaxID=1698264 RepID=A0A133UIJ2_9EURY|nr:hypothetical protein AKJ65_05585 [candidate division MSBL1 archaeon SCGC-AAA259E19]